MQPVLAQELIPTDEVGKGITPVRHAFPLRSQP
jgi:hypothetical protein